jgi:hypothetical protein
MVPAIETDHDPRILRNRMHRRLAIASPFALVALCIGIGASLDEPRKPTDRSKNETKIEKTSTRAESRPDTQSDVSEETREILWMEKGKKAVKEKLKDPDSAKFRNVFFSRGTDNVPCSCGEVNARNAFGGYIGYQRFISGGSAELTFVENEVVDFETAWERLCAPGQARAVVNF